MTRYSLNKSAKSGLRLCLLMVCFISLLSLSGCGFHPIYGSRADDKPVSGQLNLIGIASIADKNGQRLRNDLIDRMYLNGRPEKPMYFLVIALHQTEEGIGLLPNATTSLTELNLYADYSLTDKSGKELVRATAHSVATFNQLQQEYGTLAASEDAYQRCVDQISIVIVDRLSLYFSEGTIIKPPAPVKLDENSITDPNLKVFQ